MEGSKCHGSRSRLTGCRGLQNQSPRLTRQASGPVHERVPVLDQKGIFAECMVLEHFHAHVVPAPLGQEPGEFLGVGFPHGLETRWNPSNALKAAPGLEG